MSTTIAYQVKPQYKGREEIYQGSYDAWNDRQKGSSN